MKAVVYRHRRIDNNEVFYVGVGARKDRPYSKRGRNKHWLNVARKVGYEVDILTDRIPYKEALELECLLICEYGRIDLGTGCLVNMTDGGEGTINFSQKTKDRISKSKMGHKVSLKTRDKISKKLLSNNRTYKHKEETKLKISEINKVAKKKGVLLLNTGEKFDSILEASSRLGIYKSNIGRSCRNGRKTRCGLKFKFV